MFRAIKTSPLVLGVGVLCLSLVSILSFVSTEIWAASIYENSKGLHDHRAEIHRMQLSQNLRFAAAASQDESESSSQGNSLDNRYPGAKSSSKPKDLLDRTGGMPMGTRPVQDPSDETETSVYGPSVESSSVESRFPGAKSSAEPKDLYNRTGGMPIAVPPVLDIGETPREKGILRRQQILNRFNPALGFVIETIGGYTQRRMRFVDGDGDDAGGQVGTKLPAGFSSALRTIELFAAADIDPFARAYVIAAGHAEGVNARGSEEFGKAFFEIEEAAIQTTSLPYNLSIRGGRFFADWGYLGRRHAHDLPQIDIPPTLALYMGQGNRTDGIELSWLAPTDTYLALTAGYGFHFGWVGEGPLSSLRTQPIQGSTVFGSARTYKDLSDDHNVELGFSFLYTPQSRVAEASELAFLAVDEEDPIDRRTFNVDFHYRWYPLGRGLRQSVSLHGEILYDYGQGRRSIFGNTKSRGAWGGYVYAEYRFNKQWRPGFRFDWHQLPSEPALVTNPKTGNPGSTVNTSGNRTTAVTYSPYITYYPSEFHRLVLQYNHSRYGNTFDPQNQVLLQWQVVIGSHQHGFTERE